MSTQRTKGHVKINSVKGRSAPGARPSNGTISRLTGGPNNDQTKMHSAHIYDHGVGPEAYTRMKRAVAKTGRSQSGKQGYLSLRGKFIDKD